MEQAGDTGPAEGTEPGLARPIQAEDAGGNPDSTEPEAADASVGEGEQAGDEVATDDEALAEEPLADEASRASDSGGEVSPGQKDYPAPEDFEEDEAGYSEDFADYDGDDGEYGEDGDYSEDGEPAAPRQARRWPRVLLAGGFVLAAVAIVGGAIAIVGSVTHGFKKPVKVTYKTSPVFSLTTGDCFNPQGAQSYALVSCDSPHQAEVFATFAAAGSQWPGTAAIRAEASSGCASRLTSYVNPQLAVSLTSTYVYPDAVAWQAGTRTVICEVRATSGDLTGSVRGANASASAASSAQSTPAATQSSTAAKTATAG